MYKCYPVDYINITTGFKSSHQAIDLGWWGNTSDRPIYSVSDGIVKEVRNNYETTDRSGSSYGNYILIENEDGSRSTYAHLKYASCLVKVGDRVKQHQQIATMGNTGYSFGPHLHYEHRINGVKVNPFDNLYRFDYQEVYTAREESKYVKDKPIEPEPVPVPTKSIDELAKEVIEGKWGNNPERKEKLIAAGYDYEAIQNKVNEMLAPKVDMLDLVKRTIRGDFGNGDERKRALGSNYDEVQRQVNLNFQNGTTRWDNIKLY